MKKPIPFILEIPEPCAQDWDQMTPAGRGRHCDQCSKTVVDFSAMSDAQLLSFLKTSKGNICGRLSGEQLARVWVQPGPARRRYWPTIIATTGLLLSLIKSAEGQSLPPISRAGDTLILAAPQKAVAEKTKHAGNYPPVVLHISGTLLDERKNPVINAKVRLIEAETNQVVASGLTDFDGNYLFRDTVYIPAGAALNVEFSYYGPNTTVSGIPVQTAHQTVDATIKVPGCGMALGAIRTTVSTRYEPPLWNPEKPGGSSFIDARRLRWGNFR